MKYIFSYLVIFSFFFFVIGYRVRSESLGIREWFFVRIFVYSFIGRLGISKI